MPSEAPTTALLPCPFCGGEASMDIDGGRRGTSRQSCIVVCLHCGCTLESGDEGSRCGMTWNQRAPLPPIPTERQPFVYRDETDE
jgi:Lar family restriction alleviation protein